MAQIAVKGAISLGQSLLSMGVDMASEEVHLLRGVRDEILFIVEELQIMSPFIKDAEAKEMFDEAAKAWVNQVKDLAYIAEDCIQDFHLHLINRQSNKNINRVFSTFKYLIHTFRTLRTRHLIASKLQALKSKVDIAGIRRQRYGLTAAGRGSSEDEFNPERYLTRVLGGKLTERSLTDMHKEMVEEMLFGEAECQRRLIAVVVPQEEESRTTTNVVRKVYESLNADHFTCCALIDEPDVMEGIENVLRTLIKQVFPSPPDNLDKMGKEELERKLSNHLEEKKYLIVFDNLWNFNLLRSLESLLPKNELGSRILIASFHEQRVDDLATKYQLPVHIHKTVGKLSEEQSMKFFCKLMFDGHLCPNYLEEVSKDIVRRCSGHPKAIVSIARVLARRPNRSKPEWEETLKSFGPELDYNLRLGSRIQNLSFNYSDLPYPVKICLWYLQKFIDRKHPGTQRVKLNCKFLERLWIAEGFVTNFRQTSAEDVAMFYFEELVDRSFVIPDPLRGNIFYLHHDMSELFSSLEKSHRSQTRGVFRITVTGKDTPTNLDPSRVRSLTMFGKETPASFISPSMRMLRVLDLNGCDSLDNTHLKIIMKFYLLRYLLLRNTKVTKLPKSLRNLKHLEFLDVRSDHEVEIPETVVKLENLRFLRGKLLVSRLERWQYLQELADVHVQRCSNDFVKVLQQLTTLQKLGCHNFNPCGSEEDWVKALKQMKYIYSLSLKSVNNLDFLKDVFDPNSFFKLDTLILHGKLTTLHQWISKCQSLLKLKLAGSCLGDDAIEAIKDMDELTNLKLSDGAYSGKSLCFDAEGFSSLKKLSLKSLTLRSLSFQEGGVQSLEILHIEDCKESMKSCIGDEVIKVIGTMSSLIKLKLVGDAYNGESLCFKAEGFRSLEVLFLKSLPLKSLSFQEGAMPSLEILHIEDCKEKASMRNCLTDEVIKAIGRMSRLIELKLLGDTYNGASLRFDEGFAKLKVLFLKSMPLGSLSFQGGHGGAMLNLEQLHIEDCKGPTSGRFTVSGIESLGRLEKLYLKKMHLEDKHAILVKARENLNSPVVDYG